MKIFVEVLGAFIGFLMFWVLLIICGEAGKSKKWFDLFEKRGRDDE